MHNRVLEVTSRASYVLIPLGTLLLLACSSNVDAPALPSTLAASAAQKTLNSPGMAIPVDPTTSIAGSESAACAATIVSVLNGIGELTTGTDILTLHIDDLSVVAFRIESFSSEEAAAHLTVAPSADGIALGVATRGDGSSFAAFARLTSTPLPHANAEVLSLAAAAPAKPPKACNAACDGDCHVVTMAPQLGWCLFSCTMWYPCIKDTRVEWDGHCQKTLNQCGCKP